MTDKLVASAVLGEYLTDVQIFWTVAPVANKGEPVPRQALQASLDYGLARHVETFCGGPEAVQDYWRWLLHRAQHERNFGRYIKRQARGDTQPRVRATPQTAATSKPAPSRPKRRQRSDARVSDKRIRAAVFGARDNYDNVNRGVRRLAEDAGVSEASVRRALRAWQADGQLVRVGYGPGRTSRLELHLEHPAWSQHKTSHLPSE
jgi:hypothetical protein